MTEAQQRVKVGDVLHIKPPTMGYLPIVVLRVSDSGVEGREFTSHPIKDVHFVAWDDLVLPDPPKAKPGVRYRRASSSYLKYDKAVGLANGDVLAHELAGEPTDMHLRFDESWREVPE